MPPSMKVIMGIMTSPTSRSNATPSVEQYRTDTFWGMWLFFFEQLYQLWSLY